MRQHLGPGVVGQADARVGVDPYAVARMDAPDCDLVGDRQHDVDPVLPGERQVAPELLGVEAVSAGLDLDQGLPGRGAVADLNQAVGPYDGAVPQLELRLDERLDGRLARRRRSEGCQQRRREVTDDRQHG
jgi:hypothetical protein